MGRRYHCNIIFAVCCNEYSIAVITPAHSKILLFILFIRFPAWIFFYYKFFFYFLLFYFLTLVNLIVWPLDFSFSLFFFFCSYEFLKLVYKIYLANFMKISPMPASKFSKGVLFLKLQYLPVTWWLLTKSISSFSQLFPLCNKPITIRSSRL